MDSLPEVSCIIDQIKVVFDSDSNQSASTSNLLDPNHQVAPASPEQLALKKLTNAAVIEALETPKVASYARVGDAPGASEDGGVLCDKECC